MLDSKEKRGVGQIVERPSDGVLAIVNVLTINDNQPCREKDLYFVLDIVGIRIGELYIDDCNEVRKCVIDDEDYWRARLDYKRIIATTANDLEIPGIPKSFVEVYAKEQGGIKEVSLERGLDVIVRYVKLGPGCGVDIYKQTVETKNNV